MKKWIILETILLLGIDCAFAACDFITPRKTSILNAVVMYHNDKNPAVFHSDRASNTVVAKGDLSETEKLRFLLFLAHGKCVISMNQFSMFDRISCGKLSPELRGFLTPQVKEIEKRGATEDVAQRYSIMCAFDISWNESIKFMEKIAKEGAFSHEYSLEEALFIAHMHTKAPSAIERWLKGKRYHEEQLMYEACLAASIAKILTTDGRLPGSFSFDKATITTESRESLVNSNVKKLVNAYLGDQQ